MFERKMLINSPCDGEIIKLEDVKDQVFSQKLLGNGIAIIPTNGYFIAPCDGELVTVFDTKHAYGITNKKVEILIHIGLDTVNLGGKGFDCVVSQGEKVKAGDHLVTVDLDFISKKVSSIQTPIIITNKKEFNLIKTGKVKAGEPIMEIK